MNTLGSVKEIWRYPVKSMAGECVEQCATKPGGLVGDRGWALWDVKTGKVGSAKRMPALLMCTAVYLEEPDGNTNPHALITFPDGSSVQTNDANVDARLSAYLDRDVTLKSSSDDETIAGGFFDDLSHSILSSASMDALGEIIPDATLEVRRFRPNLYIETAAGVSGFAELGWEGKSLQIGSVKMTAGVPIPRCVMVSMAQPALDKDEQILRRVLADVNRCLGIYAATAESGMIRVGDRVEM